MEWFRNVGLMGRPGNTAVADTLLDVQRFLEQEGRHVIFDEDTAALLPSRNNIQVSSRQSLGEACDLVIVVGGDGSLLHAARTLARSNTPVLGINRGRLGFLTDVAPREIEAKVGAVLRGDFAEDKRFLLHAEVRRDGEPLGSVKSWLRRALIALKTCLDRALPAPAEG